MMQNYHIDEFSLRRNFDAEPGLRTQIFLMQLPTDREKKLGFCARVYLFSTYFLPFSPYKQQMVPEVANNKICSVMSFVRACRNSRKNWREPLLSNTIFRSHCRPSIHQESRRTNKMKEQEDGRVAWRVLHLHHEDEELARE